MHLPSTTARWSTRRQIVATFGMIAFFALIELGVGRGSATAHAQPVVTPRAAASLPMRNLIVEVRQSVDDSASSREVGLASAGVSVATGSGATGGGATGASVQGSLQWRASGREQTLGSTQQVLVLNGGQAGVRVAAQTPWQFVQIAVTPQGVSAWPSVTWIESATGFRVRPRWPGGPEPVQLDIEAEAAAPAGATPSGASQLSALTTVQVPLGEWVTVARSAQDERADDRGTLRSSSAQRHQQRLLQIRVSLP